jgi:putative endonuclease
VLGQKGEDLAVEMYESLGYRVLERNFRVDQGEVDIVVERDGVVVFCEVKTRRSDLWGSPAEAVAWRKQQRLRGLAARWMRERRPGAVEMRFDVVSIVVGDDSTELTHLPNAF